MAREPRRMSTPTLTRRTPHVRRIHPNTQTLIVAVVIAVATLVAIA